MKTNNAVESVNGGRLCLAKTWGRLGSLVLLFLSVAWLPALNAATVATDESDYVPYTLVSITGTGFQPGEAINNQIVQVAGPAPGTSYAPWTAQADTNGNFATSWLVFSDDLIGTTLQLTSIGQSSGLSASTSFSDSLSCPGLQTGIAPISTPSGGFGIDGDLLANAPVKGVGDWLPDSSGLGGVLDASGCPLNGLTTYHLIDAANSSLDNNYSTGKADDSPNNWTWTFGPVGSKVDLKHALIHTGRDANGHVWVVVGATRQSNNGDAYVDFEFLQNPLAVVTNAAGTGGTFSSAGPNGGRTINDFVLAITLTGGGTTPNLCVFRWNQVGVDGQGNPTYDYTNSTSVLPANSVFGAMNTAPVSIPNCYSNVVDTYAVNDFGEVAVDVTAMITGFDPCATESIGTIFVKSKQSQSPSAQLGDFITPQQVYQPIIIGPGAFAGPNQANCVQGSSTSFTMAGSAHQGTLPLTSTNWTVVSGFATIDQPGSLTPTVTVYGAGTNVTLRLTVTDSGTCANSTQHSDVILTVNPIPSVTVNSPATCAGSPATIKATVGVGTAPFAYAWTVPATASAPGNVDHFSATVAGIYSVVVTDANGCTSASASGTLTVNPNPSVTVNGPATCAGSAATIQATVGIGTAPFAFAWTVPASVSNPGDVDHFSATVAGTYSVVVTDANGCTSASASGTLTVNPHPSVTVNSPATCAGSAATIQATVGSGTGPFAYAWTVPATASNPGNLDHFSATVAGTYSVVVTDANGCTSASASGTLTVNPNPSVTVNSPATCAGSAATIKATVSIGAAPFAYAWTVPATVSNPGNVDHLSAAVAGTYSVVVTDANGCVSASASGTLTVNPNPSVTVNSPATCAGSAATIQAIVGIGTAPFAYAWTVPANVSNPGNVDHFSATVAGTYRVVVTDANGCTSASASGTLTLNPNPSVTVNSPATCAGSAATIQATVTSGIGPFAYSWTVPAAANSPGNVDHFSATVAGTYTVVVTDANGCTSASASGTLTVNPNPSVTVNSPSTCAGSPTTIQAMVSNGAGPFTYVWTVPAGASDPGNVDHFSATVAGTYSVVVTGGQGCISASASGTLTVNPVPSVTVNSPATCAGIATTIQANVSSGTGPFTYAWTVPATASNPGNVDHFSATVPGTYSVLVTDSKSCSSSSASGTLTVNSPPSVAVNSPVACAGSGATIQATVSGGTAPFAYAWTVPATASNPGNVDHFSATLAGTYSVVVTDSKSCNSASASGTLTVNPTPSLSATAVQPACSTDTGSITASASGGTTPYMYSLDGTTFVASGAFSGLPANSYTITARDANGCTSTKQLTITVPSAITLIATPSQPKCSTDTGFINASATGGTGTITYSKDGVNFQPSGSFTGLSAGMYSVTAKDGNGCNTSMTVTINQAPPPMALSLITVQPVCSTDTGSVTVSASGGAPSYTYSKDGVKFQTSGSFTGLSAGTCTITAKDANGCTCAQAVTIASPPAVSCAISGLSDVQLSATGNTITATANGGTPPYTFSWDCNDPQWTMTGTTDGSQSSTITYNAPADNDSAVFTVKTTDAHGCTAVCTMTVSCLPPSFVTDSSLCTFTSPFRLIFTQDPTNMPCLKLTASNPGQFYYNMTYLGAPGQRTATFYITLPYPFVTQGAQPIHAYDSVTIQNSGGQACLTPGNPIFASKDQVTLDSYGPNPVVGVTKIILVEKVPLSPLGYAYLNIHLDYGLKKAGGYTPGGPSGKDAVACSNSSVIPIPDLKADNLFYNFGYTVGNVVVNTSPGVQSQNDFSGVAGEKPASSRTSVLVDLPAGPQAQ